MSDPTTKAGTDWGLEEQADELLRADRVEFRRKHKGDRDAEVWTVHGILSPDQLQIRAEREICFEPALFRDWVRPGMFRRAWNPNAHKRPVHLQHLTLGGQNPTFDSRLPGDPPTPTPAIDSFTRDPGLAPGVHWWGHLDRYQRSRIRAVMRKVPAHRGDARMVVRMFLAEKYGVPPWIVERCVARE